MSSIVVSDLDYAPPGAEPLFFDVSFGVSPGEHAALVGPNGVGKSTILRILSGELDADGGEFAIGGSCLRMTQGVGMSSPDVSLRQMLLTVAPPGLRTAGTELMAAERALADGTDDVTTIAYADSLNRWGDLGGYELEVAWAAAAERSVKTAVEDFDVRTVGELSGGERKRLVLDLLLSSDADVLLLDEPDNYLDIPTRLWFEEQILATSKTILMVSHDRALLERATTKIVAVEGSGCWVHGGSYATFPEAREHRQKLLGDARQRWQDEERRLYRHMKIMKQRAAVNFKNATKADAAETRWKKFVDAGPPPPPVPDQQIKVGLRGADSARRVLDLVHVAIDDLFLPFSDEIHFGERVGLIGPNGTGKTHLLRALAGSGSSQDLSTDGRSTAVGSGAAGGEPRHDGRIGLGPRTSIGTFTQVNDRPDFVGRDTLDIVMRRADNEERSMRALGRYRLADHARQSFDTLSGGQKARLEILCLELEGHNVLLLDEPTDNLDIESAEALELALDGFVGTVLAVSHDRSFLARLDRFLLLGDDGAVWELPDYDLAMLALADPDRVDRIRLAKLLTAI